MTTIATFKNAGGSAQIEISQRHEPASAKQVKQIQATCCFILAI